MPVSHPSSFCVTIRTIQLETTGYARQYPLSDYVHSLHITDYCSGALSTEENEADSSVVESSGLAETFYRLTLSDEMKETAMLEWIVLPRLHFVPRISLRYGRRCAA
jgi:hypothetical protein